MKLSDILKTVGSGLIQTLLPGTGSLIVAGLNAVLPKDKQLPDNATGEQAQQAIAGLSPEQQASVLNKEYDVKIEEIRGFTDRFKAMSEVDKTGNSTRPEIAKMMAEVTCFVIITTASVHAYATLSGDSEMVKAIVDGWQFYAVILGIPSALLRAYFAMRTKEKQHKYEAVTGTKALPSLIQTIMGKLK